MLEMYDQLGTPDNKKREVAFPNATNHVLASPLWNKDYETVKKATFQFAEDVLGMQPVPPSNAEIAEEKTMADE